MTIRRFMALGALTLAVGMAFQAPISAMGGGGGDKDTPVDNTRRLKMVPVEEGTNAYGWVRISADSLSLGANRIAPDNYYTIYYVNGSDKQAVGEEPTIQSSGAGEAKFTIRLTEPLGAKWSKIVMYQHTDGKAAISDTMKPCMECSLK
jgi:hypothetical protein